MTGHGQAMWDDITMSTQTCVRLCQLIPVAVKLVKYLTITWLTVVPY